MRALSAATLLDSGSVSSGRSRLYAVWFASREKQNLRTNLGEKFTLKNGSASGDTITEIFVNPNSLNNVLYDLMDHVNFPASGLLFEDGIYFDDNSISAIEVMFIFEGS
jgi:hypothetical protein